MIFSVILRLILIFILSFLFGYQRQKTHKPIGFGTYTFVSVGACALALVALSIAPDNPLPLLSAIVTGIGFLGAGALIKTGDRIFGFTSAASIWLFAIIGLTVGVGQYLIGILIYFLAWCVVFYDLYLEKKGIGSYQTRISISTNKIVPQKEIKQILMLNTKKSKIIATELDKKENRMTFTYIIEGKPEDINTIPKRFLEKDWFESYRSY